MNLDKSIHAYALVSSEWTAAEQYFIFQENNLQKSVVACDISLPPALPGVNIMSMFLI